MNNKTITYHLLLLLSALMLPSCSQEDIPAAEEEADNARILFRVSLPDDESRSSDETKAEKLNGGFHVTAFCPEDENPQNPYFEEQSAKLLEDMPGCFGIFDQSDDELYWPSIRHGKTGKLKFFAFYPSREALRQNAGAASNDFGLTNKSSKDETGVTYDYRITKFKVHKDITRHIDFVTAAADGSLKELMNSGKTGMELAFEHQLCRIILTAWGNTGNDIEIAGVRIGNAVVESDFNFGAIPTNLAKGDATDHGDWVDGAQKQVKGCVEYIYRTGDTVVKIGNGNHTSAQTAASIMGNGGWAMVIPADNKRWNLTTDKKT